MANRALTANETTLIRSYQWIDDIGIFVTPLQSVVTGTISAVPSRFPYTTLTMAWDGATTGTAVGQLVEISSAGTIIAYAAIRQAISVNTLYISETQIGTFGYATNVQVPITVGMTVTIYKHHPMWAFNSRIADKTFYKFWDIAYNVQNERQQPVANTGAWQAGRLENGASTYRFTLPKGGVNLSWAFLVDSTAISNLEWTLPAGVTLVAGYSDTDEIIEVDAVAGQHQIALTVFFDGQEHTAYCWLFVADGISGYNLNENYAFAIDSDNQSLSGFGRVMKLTVTGDNLEDTFYRGAGFMLKEWAKYDGEELDSGVTNDSFIGYIADVQLSHDGNIGTAQITVEAPMVYAARLGQPSQSLTYKANPANWNETAYDNPRAFIYYLIKWTCPTLIDMHDLDIPLAYEDYRRKYLEVNNKSLQGNLQAVAEQITGHITSASDGSTIVRRNPLYMSNTARNAIATVTTFLEQDIKAPFEYFRRLYNAFSEVRSGAFAFSTGTPKAWYVGRRWLQGSGSTEMPNFIVTPTEGLNTAREIVGHFEAEQNAEIQEIGLSLLRNQDVIEPAYLLWYAFSVSTSFDPYASGFSSQRLLATEINREWEVDDSGLKKRINIIGKVETFGQLGEELPVGNVKGLSQGGWSIGFPIFWIPDLSTGMFSGNQIANLLFALNEDGDFAVTSNYLTQNVQWSNLNAALDDEAVSDFDFDYGSNYFASGRDINEALGLYVVTLDGDNGHIWYFSDILRSNAASIIKTITLNDTSSTTNARIKCSETYPDLVLAVFKDRNGVQYTRSTNGGATFGSLTDVASAIVDIEDNDNAPIGLAVFGQYQFVTAPNASNEYGVYRATTASGAFTKMTASQDSPIPHPMIAQDIESDDFIYATQYDVGTYSNDNDGSDYFPFGVPADPDPKYRFISSDFETWVRDGIVAGGVSGNALKFTGSSLIANNALNGFILQFEYTNLGASVPCWDISFDVRFDSDTASKTLLINLGVGSSVNTAVSGQNEWHHIQASEISNYSSEAPLDAGNSTINVSFKINNGDTGTAHVYLDNITLYIGDGAKLWRVTDATGTPSWANISPATGKAPEKPFDFFVDLANEDTLNTVTGLGDDWYRSTNNGTAWTLVSASTNVRCFFTSGDNIFAAGQDAVLYSADGGDDYFDISGNLDNAWDGIGRVKKLLAL